VLVWRVSVPRHVVASCAFVRMMSQRLARPCVSNLSVSPQTQNGCFGGDNQCAPKWVFPVVLSGKLRHRMALSCAAHSVSTGLGEIKQPRVSALSAGILIPTLLLCLPFFAGR